MSPIIRFLPPDAIALSSSIFLSFFFVAAQDKYAPATVIPAACRDMYWCVWWPNFAVVVYLLRSRRLCRPFRILSAGYAPARLSCVPWACWLASAGRKESMPRRIQHCRACCKLHKYIAFSFNSPYLGRRQSHVLWPSFSQVLRNTFRNGFELLIDSLTASGLVLLSSLLCILRISGFLALPSSNMTISCFLVSWVFSIPLLLVPYLKLLALFFLKVSKEPRLEFMGAPFSRISFFSAFSVCSCSFHSASMIFPSYQPRACS